MLLTHIFRIWVVIFSALATLILPSCIKTEPSALEKVTARLCDQPIVLLGEGSNHGGGATAEFKAVLTQKLIESCGFNTVIFEASMYELADISTRRKAGDVISQERFGAAVGGLWSDDREFQPLLKFLTQELNAGHVTVAGMDDQLSGRGQAYANDRMIVELTEFLPAESREECRAKFRQKIYFEFPKDAPYSESIRHDLRACLAAIAKAPQTRPDLPVKDMAKSIDRWLAGDFLSWRQGNTLRDASMYENYAAFQARSESGHKTIIWGATVHFAKSARTIPSFSEGSNFGELLLRRSKRKPYVLGFSAGSGSIRLMNGEHRELPEAQPESLEGKALAQSGRDIVFVDTDQLRRFGEIKASALNNKAELNAWSELVDGIVVFREQRPKVKLVQEPTRLSK